MSSDSQVGFLSLDVASCLHEGCIQTVVGHKSLSASGSSIKSNKRPFHDDERSKPAARMKQDLDEEIIMMVAALEACELSRTEAQNAGDNLLASSTNITGFVEPLRGITNPGPPKRFHRRGALWSSITRRLLLLEQSTRSSMRRISPSVSINFNGL